MQPQQLDYNQPPGILDTPKSSRPSLPTTPETGASEFMSPASSHSSLTPTMQKISIGRGHGRPHKQLIEPTYDSTKEEKARWLKMKATEQWHYNILTSNKAAEYRESEKKRVSEYTKRKKSSTAISQPKDKPQEKAEPEESCEISDTEDKQEASKEKSRLWYVKYIKLVTTLIPEIVTQVTVFFMHITFIFGIKIFFRLFVVVVQRHLLAQMYRRELKPSQIPKAKLLQKKCKLTFFFLIFIHTDLNDIVLGLKLKS